MLSLAPASGSPVTEEGLRRGLSRFHALAIVVGGIIGTGIFIRPAVIAQQVGTAPRMLIVWCVAGLLSLAGALTYAELAARFPRSGGEYAFLRETLGELPAFLFGWMRLTVGVAILGAMGAGVAVFLADLVPLGEAWWHVRLWPGAAAIDLGPRQGVAALAIFVLALLNISGVARAGRFQGIVTSAKVIGLAGLIGAIVLWGHPRAAILPAPTPAVGASPTLIAWGAALLAAMACFNGWAQTAMVAGEVRDPRRTLPRVMVAGVAITTVLYLLANAAFLQALPMDVIVGSNSIAHPEASSVASRAAATLHSVNSARLLSLLFLVSALGTLHCNLLLPSRVLFAMARDGLLPGRLARVAESVRTPAVAIAALALLGMAFAALGGYDRLSNMSVFGNLAFYAVNAFGLLWWRRRAHAPDTTVFRAPRGVPQLFLVVAVGLLLALIAGGSVEVLAALGLMALGVPVYAAMRGLRAAAARAQPPEWGGGDG